MRVTYVGNFIPERSTENDVADAFEHLGWEVAKVQENQTNVQKVTSEALKSELFLITSTWDNALPISGMIDLYQKCAESGIPTATLHLDTFWGKSRGGRKWWLNPMFHTAYIFTADGDYQEQWKAFGKNHIWLPPAIRHSATHMGKFREEYECDVAFVGSNGHGYHEDVWPYRKELVDNLREMCRRNGWSFKNPGGDGPKVDRGEDLNDFYASSKVTVGDSLCLARRYSQYWSDRVPEATGRGGLLIMPEILELMHQWPILPMYRWGDFEDLEACIASHLGDPENRYDVVRANFEHTRDNHTYVNRVETILKEVGL